MREREREREGENGIPKWNPFTSRSLMANAEPALITPLLLQNNIYIYVS
jgi:hypothetical protein